MKLITEWIVIVVANVLLTKSAWRKTLVRQKFRFFKSDNINLIPALRDRSRLVVLLYTKLEECCGEVWPFPSLVFEFLISRKTRWALLWITGWSAGRFDKFDCNCYSRLLHLCKYLTNWTKSTALARVPPFPVIFLMSLRWHNYNQSSYWKVLTSDWSRQRWPMLWQLERQLMRRKKFKSEIYATKFV